MPGIWIEIVPDDWPLLQAVDELLYEVLYRDFGVPWLGPWRHTGPHGVLAVAAAEDGRVFGAARLVHGAEGEPQQVRQLAVRGSARGHGVGHALLATLEDAATERAARVIWLNARENAYGFYQREGYGFAGDTFVSELTRIPHRRMAKELTSWRCISCRHKRPGIWVPEP